MDQLPHALPLQTLNNQKLIIKKLHKRNEAEIGQKIRSN